MAAAGGAGVAAALWSEVNRCGQNGDFARALKSVNKILQISKDDVTALQCKVVCLIQNGNFKEALGVINTHSKVLTSDVIAFEKAYCEYRLNRIENALKTIQSASQQTDKLKELYGQVLYRLERYDDCLAAYRDLIRNSQDEYEEERKTNLSAVVAAQSTWEKVMPEDLGLREATYELCYNSACALIGQGKLNEAMKKLQKAEELCRQSLSEDSDVTEEDIEAELAIIHGQMAYIMQLQGRTEDALQLYNQIIKLKPTDVGLLAVIANNIITINKDQNVFDSKKKVKLTNAEGVEHKLSKKQLQAIEFNKALLAMYTNQADQCRKLSASLQSQSPEHLLPVLIQAAQLCREKQHAKAVGLLQDFADQHPANAAEIKLTMAQLKIAQGSVTKACMILRSIEELQHKPGMVSALVTMYSHEEDIDSAIEVFTQAIQWYQQFQPKSPIHLSLIREAANFKLKHGRKKEAISDLEELWKQNPKDVHTLAQLISAYSLVDPEKAKVLSKHLPSSDTMSLKVDVDALENSHGATYVRKKAGKLTGDNQQKEQGQGDIKKKKKKKKGKLPKNYDPKVTPDPERWLPMRERSYYRGRKKGKKKDQVGKGTQGSTTAGSSELDASRIASSPPTSPRPGNAAAVSATSNVIPPRHQKPAGAPATKKKQQQKKKKGAKGGCTAKILSWLSSPDIVAQGKGHSKQILVLGLDGAGKTSVLHCLATNHVKRSLAPTEGFNAVCVSTGESQMEFLERMAWVQCTPQQNLLFLSRPSLSGPGQFQPVGGSECLRSYWKMYLPKVLLLIYVVDSADHARLPVAKQLLHQMIQNNSTLPVVVLANKQDLEGAYCITDIHDALALSDIGDKRKMFLIGTHVAEDGSEISSSMKDAKELIAQLVLEAQ
ncbi:signal recognition particle subunit SRP72 isoform B [Patagioenas fasciata monilis]|uniref:Signal recognition particle subunit SRP72 n=2 Tax=Columbidae TaxID=8930 RepID=A0A1V4JSU5_PATFA|nr:signal recognition particle subunit SRP72 isoform B [Patagioenas fasciata monilis]